MSQNVSAAMQVEFANNVDLVLQQQKSPIIEAGAVIIGNKTGAEKIKVKDLVGNTAAKEADDRHGKTQWGNRSYDGVWLPKPNELYDADIIDNADELGTTISLQGTATMAAAGTINRAKTQRILEGFYGDIISGKTGTVTTAFPGGQIIPVTTGGAAGAQKMNTKKLREANLLLDAAYVDKSNKRWMVLTGEDNDALLDEVPATSEDFKKSFGAVVDENGRLMRMLGWNFIHEELDNPLLNSIPDLATDGSGYRRTPFWVQGGLVGNSWQDMRSELGKIAELRFSLGWLVGTTIGATRTQPGMSGQILNLKN